MSRVKVAGTALLTAVLLSACGIPAKPQAGTPNLDKQKGFYGHVDNPLAKHVKCLKTDHIKYRKYFTHKKHFPAIQVGKLPAGPTIVFYPTAGAAQYMQIEGDAQGAEAIGAALLFPNQASTKVLTKVENCTKIGVAG